MPCAVYAVYAAQRKVLRIMLLGLAVQLATMIVSLGLSINKVRTGWDCKAADLPTEMVLYRSAMTASSRVDLSISH